MKSFDIKERFGRVTQFVNARSARERLFIIVFSLIFVLFADVFGWLLPVSQLLTHRLSLISAAQTELDSLKDDKQNEALIRKKWDSIQKELMDNETRLSSGQVSSLLENLSKLATESGVKIVSLKPTETSPPAGKKYFAVPVQISAVAGTHELGMFLEKMEAGGTFFTITDIKISANPVNERKHAIEMMTETYRKS